MSSPCCTCMKPKASLECVKCHSPVCKHCAQFVDDERFSYLPPPANSELTGTYCSPCFDIAVGPAQAAYDEIMARANEVSVFFSDQGKETRTIKRSDFKFKIASCKDRDETVHRLAFFAAKAGFNGLVDVELATSKSRDGSFKFTTWSGSGTAAHLTNAEWFSQNGRRSPSR
jgi:uncharacterized protein YbjQ (UPF0145 family)